MREVAMELKNLKGNTNWIRGGTNTGVYVFEDNTALLIDVGLGGDRPDKLIKILEENNNLVFLRKIKKGKSDRSYGIEVAKLSGLPNEIIDNAKIIMDKLSTNEIFEINKSKELSSSIADISNQKILAIKNLASAVDINSLTPIEAINKLNDLLKKIGEL